MTPDLHPAGAGQKPGHSKLDQFLAGVCRNCPLCRRARQRPKGAAAFFVQHLEKRFCPFCRAYARVYGRPAHEPMP